FQPLFVEWRARRREIPGRRQPQTAAIRQLDQFLNRRATDRVFANELSALVADERGGKQLSCAGRPGVDEQEQWFLNGSVARPGRDGFPLPTLGFAHGQGAGRHEKPRQRETLIE